MAVTDMTVTIGIAKTLQQDLLRLSGYGTRTK
jgi:hypothetical protein